MFLELAPSQESSNCIEVRKSILKTGNLQYPQKLYELDDKGNFALTPEGKRIESPDRVGPEFCLACKSDYSMIINGIHFRRNDCIEDKNPDPKCIYSTCFYCKTVKGSNDANWYWKNPEGEWILVNLMDCYTNKGLND
ncbi:unnamed protein product [Meloidogyne enterolobii]|uniref:Uncharacterized protein n=2 Tax=Meloidogyne enterolobii TaxID=390850 RepID=A0ACB0YNJ9_MELEN